MKILAVKGLEVFSVITYTPKQEYCDAVALSCCAVTLQVKDSNTSSGLLFSG